ncbi:putative lipase/esterase [Sphaerisporangium krabiense]|uniref:Acetyl esterase/lipase n=1 Tax=Sphaerisporangium krabiense TaxID=763782 RepID=A0A7W9DQ89_9ACTN|nr:alpha/beta hydrolase [Sphaerisporangium krabiense]MBB5627158.1 acetyl esterase/lipase [Sphaerisporangium krabiense]GII65316.1 putative lipase/esterase [Sphaerisporangium krabiense]
MNDLLPATGTTDRVLVTPATPAGTSGTPGTSGVTRLDYGPGERQHVLVYRPATPARAAVVLVHGGFWRPEKDAASMEAACLDLAARGVLAASAEYRTVGAGGEWPGCADDVTAAVRALCESSGVPLAATVLAGHSAGGHLALVAATRLGGLGAVAGLAPITDLEAAERDDLGTGAVRGLLGGRAAAERPDASPLRGPAPGCPVLLVHGAADQAVPVSQTTSYADAVRAKGGRVRVRLIPEARHMHLVKPGRPAWRDVSDELLSLTGNLR